MNIRPAVVVLAAGKGSRFSGSLHKLLQPLGTSTVLGTTLANVVASGLPLVVVTTTRLAPEAARFVARRDIVVLSDLDAGRGMGDSIAAGVSARAEAPGWLILPADMPMVGPPVLQAVAAALDDHPVAFAQHGGQRGHPVGFAAELYSDLVMLHGDQGARRLVGRYPACAVDVDDARALLDVDTVEDLKLVQESVPGTL